MTKLRLHAGTINHWPDEDGWQNYHLDISPRPIWDRAINMSVLPDFVGDIADLIDFREETFDAIRCHHVLEHLPRERGLLALQDFYRVLKPEGELDLEVPDVEKIVAAWAAGELDICGLSQWLLGEQLPNHEPSDSHRSVWTESLVADALIDAGFTGVTDVLEAGHACRFRAWKPQ